MCRRLLIGAWLALALLFARGVAAACGAAGLEEAEFALLEVTLEDRGQLQLEEVITTYLARDGYYLPLGELVEALEFPIDVDATRMRAEGWFLETRRGFELDLQACRVQANRARRRLDPTRVQQLDGDIYVHVSLLEAWFPLEFSVLAAEQRLLVTALEPLPIQQRRERRSRWERHRVSGAETPDPELFDDPYAFMDWPFIDLTAQAQQRWLESGETVRNDRYKLVAAGDLLFMNAQVSAAHVDGEMQDTFVTLGRRDPYNRLLGPLHASEFALGDITVGRDPLIANNVLGRGLRVSNRPLDRPAEFDRFNLQGELPLGWDVELYHNGQLTAFQSADAGARYDFLDIPLEFGINNFRLVFYGPNGQVREETLQRVIGQGMIRPGEHQYSLTAMRPRERYGVLAPETESDFINFGYDYGLTRALSVGVTGRRLFLDDVEQDYHSTHMNLALPFVFARIEHADQLSGGDAYSMLLNTRLLGFDLAAESARFNDFDSSRIRAENVPGELLERNELRLGTRLPRVYGMGLGFALELRENIGSEGERQEALSRVSLNTRYGTATHVYETDRTVADGFSEVDRSRQRLMFSTRRGRIGLRGELVQELEPERYVRTVGMSADWSMSSRTRARISATRLPMEAVNTYAASVNWRLDRFSLGVNVSTTGDGETLAGLTLSGSFVRDPGGRDWQLGSQARAHSGAVGVDVFLDENGNGRLDAGEPPVSGAGLKTNGVARIAADDSGYAFVPGLAPHSPTRIGVDERSLENPFWKVREVERTVVPRPGRTSRLQLPVTPTGSIEGTVLVPHGASARRAEGRRIHLLSSDGEPVQETRSAYDGYYYFEGIAPGFYRLRLSEREIDRAHDPQDLLVEIHGGMEIIQDADLVLHREGAGRATQKAPLSATRAVRVPNAVERAETDQQAGGYTIQLMAASTQAAVQAYVARHQLGGEAQYVRTTRRGQPWYQVFLGRHETAETARAAIRRLPAELKVAGPYIRPRISISGDLQRTAGRPSRSIINGSFRSEAWIRSRPADSFTIQVAAVSSERDAQAFIRRHGLEQTAAYFGTIRDGHRWYAIIDGEFATREQAQAAAGRLPAGLRDNGSWIRRFDGIQAQLQ